MTGRSAGTMKCRDETIENNQLITIPGGPYYNPIHFDNQNCALDTQGRMRCWEILPGGGVQELKDSSGNIISTRYSELAGNRKIQDQPSSNICGIRAMTEVTRPGEVDCYNMVDTPPREIERATFNLTGQMDKVVFGGPGVCGLETGTGKISCLGISDLSEGSFPKLEGEYRDIAASRNVLCGVRESDGQIDCVHPIKHFGYYKWY